MEIKRLFAVYISWKIETSDIFHLLIFLPFSGDRGWRFIGVGSGVDRGRGHSRSRVGGSASDSVQ